MATPRDIRRLAFQALFQLDARGGIGPADDPHALVADLLDDPGDFTPSEREKAFRTALAAFDNRSAADAAMQTLAPTWPAHRQAAVDRAILRLAHYEMTLAGTPPKIVVNEAVELAKTFSTEKSPAFINGLLDKILKQVLKHPATPESTPETTPGPLPPDPT
jgi:N utilization substance protein B